MPQRIKKYTLATVIIAALTTVVSAADHKRNSGPAENDPVYARKIDERVSKIVSTLELKNPEKARHVHDIVVAQYHLLNIWHETNDSRLKELKKASMDNDPEKAARAKSELESIKAALKTVHDEYLAKLAAELPSELIERVKDGMTAGKVQFTFKGYEIEYPAMNEEQKAKVLELLKEAREEAMDAGSMDEKSDIFNRYKGKINNWLSKQGVEPNRSKKPAAGKHEPDKK